MVFIDKIQALNEKRQELTDQLRQLHEAEGDWTDEKQREWDSLNGQYDDTKRQLENEQAKFQRQGADDFHERIGQRGAFDPNDPFGKKVRDAMESRNGAGIETFTTWHGSGPSEVLRVPKDCQSLRADQSVESFVRANPGLFTSKGRPGPQYNDLASYARSLLPGQDSDELRAQALVPDSAGGHTSPVVLAARIIDSLRAQSVATRAGVEMIPLADTAKAHDFARIQSDLTASWKAEGAQASETDMSFDKVSFVPSTLYSYTLVSEELWQDAQNLQEALTLSLTNQFALELDRVVFLGSGVSPEPTGLTNIGGISTVPTVGAIANYDPVLDARLATMLSNGATMDPAKMTAMVCSPATEDKFARLAATDNQPLMRPEVIRDLPFLESTQIGDSVAFSGNLSHLKIGMRLNFTMRAENVSRSQYYQYVVVGALRADIQAFQASPLVELSGIT